MVRALVRPRAIVLALALAGTGLASIPAAAQTAEQESRLRKMEAEVRALQRQVFPGGDGRFFSPEVITPGSGGASTTTQGATPTTSAITDILGRLDSLEGQIARLTAQSEENTNAIAQISARLDALQPLPPASSTVAPSTVAPSTVAGPPAPSPVAPVAPATVAQPAAPVVAPTPAPAAPSAARVAAVQAIAKPQTADPGDDEYSYGFRLWEAKFYPEAQQQLRLYVDKYPRHARISFGRNLLGRAYLDDGKPRDAAPWFLQNYQTDKQGARAADSLLYLAEAMIAIKDTNRACIALSEFGDSYPAIATGRLASQYDASRKKVKCN